MRVNPHQLLDNYTTCDDLDPIEYLGFTSEELEEIKDFHYFQQFDSETEQLYLKHNISGYKIA